MDFVFRGNESKLAGLYKRSKKRELNFMRGTQKLRDHFEGLGDNAAQSKAKITDVSNETWETHMRYVMGNRQPYLDAIAAISEVTYPWMDAAAKTVLTDEL